MKKLHNFFKSRVPAILTITVLILFFLIVDPSHGLGQESHQITLKNFAGKSIPIPYKSHPGSKNQESSRMGNVKVSVGNLRSRPTLSSPIIGKLIRGDRVTFLGKREEWYMVKLQDNRVAWAHEILFADNVISPKSIKSIMNKKEKQIESIAELKVDTGRVREKPSIHSNIMFRLKRGDLVTVVETEGDWYLIELKDGRLGWSHHSLFSKPHQVSGSGTNIIKEVTDILFEITSEGEENVIFLLSGYYPPYIFVVEEGKPMVVCDFFGVHLGKGINRDMDVHGRLIHRIRISSYQGLMPKVRIVLELVPSEHYKYQIQPVYFDDENRYMLIVRKMR